MHANVIDYQSNNRNACVLLLYHIIANYLIVNNKKNCEHFIGINENNITPKTAGAEECEKEETDWVGVVVMLSCVIRWYLTAVVIAAAVPFSLGIEQQPIYLQLYTYVKKGYGCGLGIGGCGGGFGAGEGPNLVVRNGIGDGLAVSVAFKSNVCPFLYTVKVTLSPTDLC
jgi:hypothetical protein